MSNVVPVADIKMMAQAVVGSNLFGIKTVEQAMSLMLIAQAEGMHPAIAARDYHVIQGKATLKADAMLARFQAAGGKVDWLVLSDEKVEAKFSHPQGGSATVDWTPERVKKAEISSAMHKKYPRQMLRARVISEGVRTVYPGCVVGVYTPEEVDDFAPRDKGAIIEGEYTEAPESRPVATKSAAQSKKDGDWEALTAQIDLMRTAEELQAWGAQKRADIDQLPGNTKFELRSYYVERLKALKAQAPAPTPTDDEIDARLAEENGDMYERDE